MGHMYGLAQVERYEQEEREWTAFDDTGTVGHTVDHMVQRVEDSEREPKGVVCCPSRSPCWNSADELSERCKPMKA